MLALVGRREPETAFRLREQLGAAPVQRLEVDVVLLQNRREIYAGFVA